MIGNNRYISYKIAQKNEFGVDDEHLLEVVINEYWRYIKHLMKHSPETCIRLPNLGNFQIMNNDARRVVRELIARVRAIRKTKSFKEGNEKALIIERDMVSQLRNSWKQLDTIRYVFLARNKNYQKKKAKKMLNNSMSVENSEQLKKD